MNLESLVQHFGYPMIVVVIVGESLGIPLPAETLLLISAAAAGATGVLTLPGLIVAGAIGAILGNSLDYVLGRKGGRPLVSWLERQWWIHADHIEYANRFVVRHGSIAILFGRFVPFVRVFAALLAGVARMDARVFFAYTVAGSVLWAGTIALLGHTFGRNLPLIERIFHDLGYGIVAVVVVVFVGVLMWRRKRISR